VVGVSTDQTVICFVSIAVVPTQSVAELGQVLQFLPKQIETLVSDIYHLLDEDTNHEPSEENLNWLAESVKSLLRLKLSSRAREAATLRFSSLGKPDRQLWYATHEADKAERMIPKTYFKFLYGDMIELLLLFLCKEAGHEVTHEQYQVSVDGVVGHCDAVIDGVTVDAKSASPFGYNKFVTGKYLEEDPFGYLGQIGGYRGALGTERAAFLVANKVHGDIALSEVPSKTLLDNEPAGRITHLKDILSSPDEPPRCYSDKPEGKSGNRALDVGCSYCSFRNHCWRDANNGEGLKTYIYSTGPKYFTHIEKEPRVQEGW
jgi:hypothetical protein